MPFKLCHLIEQESRLTFNFPRVLTLCQHSALRAAWFSSRFGTRRASSSTIRQKANFLILVSDVTVQSLHSNRGFKTSLLRKFPHYNVVVVLVYLCSRTNRRRGWYGCLICGLRTMIQPNVRTANGGLDIMVLDRCPRDTLETFLYLQTLFEILFE